MSQILAAVFFLTGSFFMFLAGLGVWRLPDVYSRMHAATKAASFGIGLMLSGIVILHFSWSLLFLAFLIIFFVFITAPIAAHMLGRAAYFRKVPQYDKTIADEMSAMLDGSA